jgi:exopolysaccharide biosynthesis polyprenyl glycosylphosphotransferase
VQICKGEVDIDSSLGIPVFHLRAVSLSGYNFYFKRTLDLVISIIVLSFIWPVLLMVAILIKIDSSGPFLYRHKRMGYRGEVFNFFKFRTMVVNADDLLEKYKKMSERKGPVFKMANDPRITRIGKTLRRYSIDELLQLLNVLRGEMSLVGPRPQVLWEASAYDDWAKRRLRVLPGITGLWQVSGRASLSYEEMIELDIYYIESWSLGLDLKILFNTLPAIFTKEGAY